jgi:hypothetical protein
MLILQALHNFSVFILATQNEKKRKKIGLIILDQSTKDLNSFSLSGFLNTKYRRNIFLFQRKFLLFAASIELFSRGQLSEFL